MLQGRHKLPPARHQLLIRVNCGSIAGCSATPGTDLRLPFRRVVQHQQPIYCNNNNNNNNYKYVQQRRHSIRPQIRHQDRTAIIITITTTTTTATATMCLLLLLSIVVQPINATRAAATMTRVAFVSSSSSSSSILPTRCTPWRYCRTVVLVGVVQREQKRGNRPVRLPVVRHGGGGGRSGGFHHPSQFILRSQSTTSTTSTTSSSSSSSSEATVPVSTCTTATTTTTSSSSSFSSTPILLQHVEFKSMRTTTSSCTTNLLDTYSKQSQSRQLPVVIFLHGLLGNKRNFASIGRSIASSSSSSQERIIYSLDLRNHGDSYRENQNSNTDMDNSNNSNNSTMESRDMRLRTMAYDVIHFCNVHNIQQIDTLIGHSMGGKVAQAVALLEPTRVKGLIVLDIAPVRYTSKEPHWSAVVDIIHTLLNVRMSSNRNDVEQQLRSSIPDPNLRAFCLTNVDWNTGQWKIPLHHIYDQLDNLASFDLSLSPTSASNTEPTDQRLDDNQVLQFTGDAFFINGGQSKFVRSSHLSSIQEYFPNHMLTTIKGAGHWVHAEAPEDTTALIQQFLNR